MSNYRRQVGSVFVHGSKNNYLVSSCVSGKNILSALVSLWQKYSSCPCVFVAKIFLVPSCLSGKIIIVSLRLKAEIWQRPSQSHVVVNGDEPACFYCPCGCLDNRSHILAHHHRKNVSARKTPLKGCLAGTSKLNIKNLSNFILGKVFSNPSQTG